MTSRDRKEEREREEEGNKRRIITNGREFLVVNRSFPMFGLGEKRAKKGEIEERGERRKGGGERGDEMEKRGEKRKGR